MAAFKIDFKSIFEQLNLLRMFWARVFNVCSSVICSMNYIYMNSHTHLFLLTRFVLSSSYSVLVAMAYSTTQFTNWKMWKRATTTAHKIEWKKTQIEWGTKKKNCAARYRNELNLIAWTNMVQTGRTTTSRAMIVAMVSVLVLSIHLHSNICLCVCAWNNEEIVQVM